MGKPFSDGSDGGMTGAEYDTLWCMFVNGPTWDGNLPSKSGRDSLVRDGLAFQFDGWQSLTEKGVRAGLALGMDRKKEQYDAKHGRR